MNLINSITFKKIGYESNQNGGMYSKIMISYDNKYFLFNIDYY